MGCRLFVERLGVGVSVLVDGQMLCRAAYSDGLWSSICNT